jgi:Tfp pilus assembly protein PilO
MPPPTAAGEGGAAGILDRFPWYVQLLVLLAIVAVCAFLVHYFLLQATYDEASQKSQQAEDLKRENQKAAEIRKHIVEYEQQLADLNAQFEQLKVRLPEQREVSKIFDDTKNFVYKNNLALLAFTLNREEKTKTYYTELASTLSVGGSYKKVQDLFRDLAEFPRIVNVTDITLKKAPEDVQGRGITTLATFSVTAFYISDANRANIEAETAAAAQPAGKPGQPGAAPAGAPGAPPAEPPK